ncbi:MAG: hypothetical protein CFE21_01305 [Bacteroidetes bacterium B1(2017)]|nr:MAG: hypothetical protein CFE21_01305 [Bacteroidetes bacterium B1(2017)]
MKNRKLNRLADYDYSQERDYFVTCNTHNRVKHFGEIKNKEMILNGHGEIVSEQWNWLLIQYPYLKSDAFIIMPDHFHAIMSISIPVDLKLNVKENQLKIKPLSELVGAFKTTSARRINLAGNASFAWQRSFYDKIIRSPLEYQNIKRYIQNNPSAWDNHHDTR